MHHDRLLALALSLTLSLATAAVAGDAESLPGGSGLKKFIADHCLKDIQGFEQQLWQVGFGVFPYGPPGSAGTTELSGFGDEGTPRGRIRALHDAARVYAYAGNERMCRETLSSMRAIYDEHQKILGKDADNPNVRMAWRRAHLSRAKPVAEMDHLMRASILIGSEIRNLKDERLGEITDIILNPDKRDILYVLASHGGFLGLVDKLVAVRWIDLRATEDRQMYVLDVAPKAFDDAPAVDRRNFSTTAEPAWQHALAQYWNGVMRK